MIKATHPEFRYQPIANPEELGDGGRVRWGRVVRVKRQLMLGLTSSLRGTAGLPRFISFSTSYPKRVSIADPFELSSPGWFVAYTPKCLPGLVPQVGITAVIGISRYCQSNRAE